MGELIRRFCLTVVVVGLVASGCAGGSSEVAEIATPSVVEVLFESPTEVAPTVVAVVPTATEVPEVVVLSDDERLAAAVAVFEADPRPDELFAYDILDSSFAVGRATIRICGWNGDTVFDQVRLIVYRVGETPGADGRPQVDLESASIGRGECQNSTLVESALQATRDFDNYWSGVVGNPASFDRETAARFFTDEWVEANAPSVERWVADGLSYKNMYLDGNIPESAVTDVLFRSYEQGPAVFELMACRELPLEFGLYRGEVLIDDFMEESSGGPHASAQYLLTRSGDQWLMAGVRERVWVDCLGFSDGWLAGVNEILGDPVEWQVLKP